MSMPWEYILRIVAAALLGGAIGLEREYRAKEAGFRTHFLVALGSALFMVISQFGFEQILSGSPNVSLDPSRIASQVVTGIGFIGAGTIIFQKNAIRGLTTAAGLWVTAAIGMGCGCGMYLLSVAATILVLIGLEVLGYVDGSYRKHRKQQESAAGRNRNASTGHTRLHPIQPPKQLLKNTSEKEL